MRKKSKGTISIIGGADGPTSIFIAGKTRKRSLSERIRSYGYRRRRSRTEKKIIANPHTLDEVVSYLQDKYGAVEVSKESHNYIVQKNDLKEAMILQHKPELLGDMAVIAYPKGHDEKDIREYFKCLQQQKERAQNIPDDKFLMDFGLYRIEIAGVGELEVCIEKIWERFGVSCSGKQMKKLQRITRDIYAYYGVSKEDIEKRSERYTVLVTILCS